MTPCQVHMLTIPGRVDGEKFICQAMNVLSREECKEWIEYIEANGCTPASVLEDGSKNPHRTNDRALIHDATRTSLVFDRIKSIVPQTRTDEDGSVWTLHNMNDRMSCLRYSVAERYGKHVDVPYEDEKNHTKSFITCQLYLNDSFKGGETRFDQEVGFQHADERKHVDIQPVTGSAALFEHNLTHEGCSVTDGTKYTVRLDVMYKSRRDSCDLMGKCKTHSERVIVDDVRTYLAQHSVNVNVLEFKEDGTNVYYRPKIMVYDVPLPDGTIIKVSRQIQTFPRMSNEWQLCKIHPVHLTNSK